MGPGTREYWLRHQHVKAARGRASNHLCACGKPAKDWATLHGRDGSKPDDYVAMCRQHHKFYDSVHSPTSKGFRDMRGRNA